MRFILALIFTFPLLASASPQSDFYISQALDHYFILPESAETLSMAGSNAISCSSSFCMYQNPAGLGFTTAPEISLGFGVNRREGDEYLAGNSIAANDKRGHVAMAIPFGAEQSAPPRLGTLAVGFSRYQGTATDALTTTSDGHRRSLAYGFALHEQIALGYAFTFYDDQLHTDLNDFHSHARFLHIFGTQYHTDNEYVFGLTYKYGLGQADTHDYTFDTDGLSYLKQHSVAIGVTKQFEQILLALGFDYSHYNSQGNLIPVSPAVVVGSDEEGEQFNVRLGAESSLSQQFRLRAGARWFHTDYEFERDDLQSLNATIQGTGWSTGLGYILPSDNASRQSKLRLDYGIEYSTIGHGEWKQLVTLSAAYL